MTALIIIACFFLICFLVGRIRIGAVADYSEQGLFLRLKAGPFTAQIFPGRPSEHKAKKETGKEIKKSAADPVQKMSRKDSLSMALKFIPLVGEAAGQLRKHIRIDDLVLRVIWGSPDPADAAAGYGAGNAVIATLWPVFASNFRVKQYDIHVDVDFERESPTLVAKVKATLTISQFTAFVFRLGIKALKIYLEIHREKIIDKAVQA